MRGGAQELGRSIGEGGSENRFRPLNKKGFLERLLVMTFLLSSVRRDKTIQDLRMFWKNVTRDRRKVKSCAGARLGLSEAVKDFPG